MIMSEWGKVLREIKSKRLTYIVTNGRNHNKFLQKEEKLHKRNAK